MVEVPVVYLGVIVVERISNILTTLRIPRDDVISAQLGLFRKAINWYQLSVSVFSFTGTRKKRSTLDTALV